jgi:hypothetical protein
LDLAAWGASVGTLLDEIHAKADVLRYNPDLGGIKWEALRDAPVIGDPSTSYTVFQTSLFVPALLAAFYVVDGSLYLLLCEEEEERFEPEQLSEVVIRLGALGVMLQISALLYENYVPYEKMRWTLATLALANWAFFDKRLKTPSARDKTNAFKSLGLAVFAGVAAPLIETVLIDPLHLWHYPRPDVFGLNGFPSWVPFCYIFYHPFLFSLARYLQDKKDACAEQQQQQ